MKRAKQLTLHLVVTAFKLRVYPCRQDIYSGWIHYPKSSLPALARAVSEFASRGDTDHKMSLQLSTRSFVPVPAGSPPGCSMVIVDENGEEHGRSEQGFKWALDIEGAVDKTRIMTMREANGLMGKLTR